MMEINLHRLKQAEKAAMHWLLNAHRHGQGGFPHSRWMYLPSYVAWNKDYAETTGYLIENLLVFNKDALPGLDKVALCCGSWLCEVQSEEGYFHSGIRFETPSAFNTAQVLFGLDCLYTYTKRPQYFEALQRASDWLINSIDSNGVFYRGLYVENYYPAYYARALWPMLLMDKKYFNSAHEPKLFNAIDRLFQNKNVYGFFDQLSFYPGKPALLHTIMYALEGFYECSKITDHYQMRMYVIEILNRTCELIMKHQKAPAYISPDFKPDYSFVCVCGQAQLCSLLLKVHTGHDHKIFYDTAVVLFRQLISWQIKSQSAEHHGAFPSSIPAWQKYFPMRYTNWTMKFFLDAVRGMTIDR